jgi:hypothetical protein
MSDVTTEDVIYHGYRRAMGGSFIAVETPDGEQIGVVNHVAKHSPTGLSWGYGGSGAADCARSLLIAALGDDARCCVCGGTKKIVFDVSTERRCLTTLRTPTPTTLS